MFKNWWSYSLVFVLVFTVACKKDRLTGDKEALIGTWEWRYSEKRCYVSTTPYNFYYDPVTENETYTMEFLEKGKVFFYKNDELIEKKRIVFSKWEGPASSFRIILNNDSDDNIVGSLLNGNGNVGDTMRIAGYYDFPFGNEDKIESYFSNCHNRHYFVKVE